MPLAAPTNLTAHPASSLTAAPIIITSSLPKATVGVPYTATLVATGGVPPYTWTVNDGLLPTGLSLNSNGILSGTPSKTGKYLFDVLCTDNIKQTASITVQLTH